MPIDLSLTKNCWDELEKYIDKGDFDKELIKKGYDFSQKAHLGQKRDSGDESALGI